MPETFVALSAMLAASEVPPSFEIAKATVAGVASEARPRESVTGAPHPVTPVARDIARMRLAAIETFERSATRLLENLARDVLARELQLAPADLRSIVAAAVRTMASEEPITIVTAPGEAPFDCAGLPVREDPALALGDVVVEVRDGAYESPLLFRAACAVRDVDDRA